MFQDQAQTKKAKEQLSSLERDEEELKTKVQRLETFINNHTPTSIKELQVTERPSPPRTQHENRKEDQTLTNFLPNFRRERRCTPTC